jgi:hypothetical protein
MFIHGLWRPGDFGDSGGYATVTNLRTKIENGERSRHWNHGSEQRFTLAEFKELLGEVNSILSNLEALRKWLEANK